MRKQLKNKREYNILRAEEKEMLDKELRGAVKHERESCRRRKAEGEKEWTHENFVYLREAKKEIKTQIVKGEESCDYTALLKRTLRGEQIQISKRKLEEVYLYIKKVKGKEKKEDKKEKRQKARIRKGEHLTYEEIRELYIKEKYQEIHEQYDKELEERVIKYLKNPKNRNTKLRKYKSMLIKGYVRKKN